MALSAKTAPGLHSKLVPTPLPYQAGGGEPLVLLHGFTDTWRGWTPVLPALSARHQVYAWSLPGHLGGEPWDTSVPVSITAVVDAAERQLDNIGLDRAHLAGNSLGGWLALELAARGRALSVVGLCPAGGWEPGGREERRVARYFRRNQLLLRYFGPLLPWVARHATLRRIALRDLVADGRKVPPAGALTLFEGARDVRSSTRWSVWGGPASPSVIWDRSIARYGSCTGRRTGCCAGRTASNACGRCCRTQTGCASTGSGTFPCGIRLTRWRPPFSSTPADRWAGPRAGRRSNRQNRPERLQDSLGIEPQFGDRNRGPAARQSQGARLRGIPSALVSPLTALFAVESGLLAPAPEPADPAPEPAVPVPAVPLRTGTRVPLAAPVAGTEVTPPTVFSAPPTIGATTGPTVPANALAADPASLIAPPTGPPMAEPRLLIAPGP